MAFKFENLLVWQKALDLTLEIDLFTKTFPKEELYILTAQIKRATDSIALNIAEGSTGQTNNEFKRFLGYAIRSAVEVVACIKIAKKRFDLKKEESEQLIKNLEELLKMLHSLKKKIN